MLNAIYFETLRMWACNLSTAYRKLGDFKTAKEHHQLHQIITKEMADGAVKGRASSNLAVNFQALRHYQKAVSRYCQGIGRRIWRRSHVWQS